MRSVVRGGGGPKRGLDVKDGSGGPTSCGVGPDVGCVRGVCDSVVRQLHAEPRMQTMEHVEQIHQFCCSRKADGMRTWANACTPIWRLKASGDMGLVASGQSEIGQQAGLKAD